MSPRPRIILGSSSPRRKDLLATVRIPFEVIKPETPEIPLPGENPSDYAARNAREKSEWVETRLLALPADRRPESGWIVITADTIVVLDDKILEKPRDPAHAVEMVQSLAGRVHTVVSGVMIRAVGKPGAHEPVAFVTTTEVRIKPLSAVEVQAYVATGEPLDKAGGYAAQGIGSYMVHSINGSYANVVGLPVADVVERLGRSFGYDIWTEDTPH